MIEKVRAPMIEEMSREEVASLSPEGRAKYDAQVPSGIVHFANIVPNWELSPNTRLIAHERANLVYVGAGDYLASGTQEQEPVPGINFSVSMQLCPPGKGPPLHAHTTEEMFVVMSGRCLFYWGDQGQHSQILGEWGAIVLPGPVMRGFRNIGTTTAYVFTIIGDGNPSAPVAHESVTRQLATMGLGPTWAESPPSAQAMPNTHSEKSPS